MKNIHVLPTPNESRLQLQMNGNLHLENGKSIALRNYQNIFIISDEEIKEGDWVIQVNFEKTNIQLIQCVSKFQVKIANYKNGSFTKNKIILTTDRDLIKDGVQVIDDDFLEWFVKNPSCEVVEVEKGCILYDFKYKIIIPKEEPKQENDYTALLKPIGTKQETLEEVAERLATASPKIFKEGAKWQQERSYSDMQEYAEFCIECDRKGMPLLLVQDWYEHYKK